jgi:hypothetical protein
MSPTVDAEVNMRELRSDPRYRSHLAYDHEDGIHADPTQHPSVVDDEALMEDDNDDAIFEHINFPDDSPTP